MSQTSDIRKLMAEKDFLSDLLGPFVITKRHRCKKNSLWHNGTAVAEKWTPVPLWHKGKAQLQLEKKAHWWL